MTESQRLLKEYAETRSEAAFRELVTRYIDFVYSAAVRVTQGDTHRAQDVVQIVFADLARTARMLPRDVMLGGWLHRRACHVASTILRSERRRKSRERQAVEMNTIDDDSQSNFAQIAPVLDQAVNQLGAQDRAAILLRFFERNDFREIGNALGSNEDAAQKRVSRALEKLRRILCRRGVALTATALVSLLASEVVTAAPVGFAVDVTATSLAAAKTPTAMAFLKLLVAEKWKTAICSVMIAGSVAGPWTIQGRARAEFRRHNAALEQQFDAAARLQTDHARLTKLLADADRAPRLPKEQFDELLALRGEVACLRTEVGKKTEIVAFRKALADLPPESLWPARVNRLKQWLEANPAEKIPELSSLSSRTWLNSIYPFSLETDEECRRAMSIVRTNAKGHTQSNLLQALEQFGRNNGGQFPSEIAQLKPYLNPPLGDEILARYAIAPANSLVPELRIGEGWVITEKVAVNAAEDMRVTLGMNSQARNATQEVTNRWSGFP